MKLLQKHILFLALATLSSLSLHARAGSVEGPYVVWVNLGTTNKKAMNEKVKQYLDGADDACWQKGSSILYMRERPQAMTDELVRDGLILKNRAAIQKLNKLLTQKTPEAEDGYDGIVVFTEHDGPQFASLTTGARKIESTKVSNTEDLKKIGSSLCQVMPVITREP